MELFFFKIKFNVILINSHNFPSEKGKKEKKKKKKERTKEQVLSNFVGSSVCSPALPEHQLRLHCGLQMNNNCDRQFFSVQLHPPCLTLLPFSPGLHHPSGPSSPSLHPLPVAQLLTHGQSFQSTSQILTLTWISASHQLKVGKPYNHTIIQS